MGARARRCWRWLATLAALVDSHCVVIGLALDDGDGADRERPDSSNCRCRRRTSSCGTGYRPLSKVQQGAQGALGPWRFFAAEVAAV